MPLNADLDVSNPPANVLKGLLQGTLRRVPLQPGQFLFRFANSQIPYLYQEAGPWWVDRENYLKIIAACKRDFQKYGTKMRPLGFVGRRAIAIPFSYSQADVMVQAIVKEEINAFAGQGKIQETTDPEIIWIPWPDVEQLYIPNIVVKRNKYYEWTSLGRQALQITNCTRIES